MKAYKLPWKQPFGLVTAFKLPPNGLTPVTAEWIQMKVKEYKDCDDVFDMAFLAIVLLLGTGDGHIDLTQEAQDYLTSHGNERVVSLSSSRLMPGPYAVVGRELRDVWKLADDFNGACMTTLVPRTK